MDAKFIEQLTDDAQTVNVLRAKLKGIQEECSCDYTANITDEGLRICAEWLERVEERAARK